MNTFVLLASQPHDAATQIVTTVFVAIAVGVILALLLKEGVRYFQMTPAERQAEKEERMAKAEKENAEHSERVAREKELWRQQEERDEQARRTRRMEAALNTMDGSPSETSAPSLQPLPFNLVKAGAILLGGGLVIGLVIGVGVIEGMLIASGIVCLVLGFCRQ